MEMAKLNLTIEDIMFNIETLEFIRDVRKSQKDDAVIYGNEITVKEYEKEVEKIEKLIKKIKNITV